MNERPSPDPAEASLDFERAQFSGDTPAAACAVCNRQLTDEYYQVNESVACPDCRQRAEAEMTSGSPARRFATASLFGVVAGLVGCAIYWAVGWLTGYEFGLIAIVVGYLVGVAVRAGSARRGGLPYQLLATALTYAAIAGTSVPGIVSELYRQRDQQVVDAQSADPSAYQGGPQLAESAPAGGLAVAGRFALFAAVVFGLSMALPFLAGFENIIGIIIIVIGLWQAWKLNPRMQLEITGPYRVAAGSPGGVAALS